jgi:AcrR family transcriptional regulator
MPTADETAPLLTVHVQRPNRVDARRNFDALLEAARDAFGEQGNAASLEDIARRAGVGIGTLYRNFPCRQDLFNAIYIEEVDQLCQAAQASAALPPWDALSAWLRRFIDYVGTKRAIQEALNYESEMFCACREAMYSAGEPLLERAQAAGDARTDLAFDDMLRMVIGVAVACTDDAQRERVFALALDGIRAQRSPTH